MNSRPFPGALRALTLCLAGSVNSPVGADQVSDGRETYDNYCRSCHGADALGLVAFSGDLAVFRQRLAGNANMPDVSALLTDEEAGDLFAFLLQQRPGAANAPQ